MVRTLELYSHSNFQVYDTVILIVVTMRYLGSLELICLITENLYPLTNVSFPPPLSPWQPLLYSGFDVFIFHTEFSEIENSREN